MNYFLTFVLSRIYIFLSKVTEKAVAAQLIEHLNDNERLLDEFQSAYKYHHSTETALVKVQNDILKAVDNNRSVILLLLDLLAAFDTFDHSILLSRPQNRFGIRNIAFNWFHSYLHSREQFVSVNGIESSKTNLPYGVPQGCGRRGGSVVSAPDLGSECRELCSASLHRGV